MFVSVMIGNSKALGITLDEVNTAWHFPKAKIDKSWSLRQTNRRGRTYRKLRILQTLKSVDEKLHIARSELHGRHFVTGSRFGIERLQAQIKV